MKRLILAAALFPLLASAQQLSPEEINARIAALEQQRNEQANVVVMLAGQLAMVRAEIERLKKAAAECAPAKKD